MGKKIMQFFIIMQAENTSHPNHLSNGPPVLSEKKKKQKKQKANKTRPFNLQQGLGTQNITSPEAEVLVPYL